MALIPDWPKAELPISFNLLQIQRQLHEGSRISKNNDIQSTQHYSEFELFWFLCHRKQNH
jgi:hypothetical protein